MTGLAVPAVLALLLSVATSVFFWNVGLPLSAPSVSVVVGFWLLAVFGVRALWRLRGGKTTGS
ncbi:MAG: hypothetical protein Q8S13_02545 [Dehalococcoidia bacterium]|nr:hypothetical protein [Dehalococcoidia bacterium]